MVMQGTSSRSVGATTPPSSSPTAMASPLSTMLFRLVRKLSAPIISTIIVGSHGTTYIRFSRTSADRRTRSISQKSCQRLVGRFSGV